MASRAEASGKIAPGSGEPHAPLLSPEPVRAHSLPCGGDAPVIAFGNELGTWPHGTQRAGGRARASMY